ncbi:hypothetical protein P3531_20715 [Vibrio parahaemolyticus]|nr:hypothetical protein [Vibrio parahaemolyticus]MDG2607732.1 hypothetical protein [Vibrio parahaemolyticus]
MKRFTMEDSNPDLKSEREHHYDFNYPFPPRHHDWYWRDASMSYDEAIEAFHAQSEEDQHIRRNPVNRDTPKKVVDPNSHDGKGYPFPPRHSMTWQNNEYGVSYDEAVALYEHERAKAVNPRMVRNPLVNVSPKTPDGSRLAVQAMNQELAKSTSTPVVSPENSFWPPYNPLAKEGEKELDVIYTKPITSIAVLSSEEAYELLQNKYKEFGGKKLSDDLKTYVIGVGKGSYDAFKTAQGLGGVGVHAVVKKIDGVDWFIIKNFRFHQQTIMQGYKWKANNPQVIKMGLGIKDLQAAKSFVRVNVGLEVAFAVGINAVDYILRDEATLSEFVGNSAYDIVKGVTSLAVSTAVTAALLSGVASVTILGAGLLFVAVSYFVGEAVNVGFDALKNALEEFTEDKAREEAEDYIRSINGYSYSMSDALRNAVL